MTFSERSAWVMSLSLFVAGLFYVWTLVATTIAFSAVPPPNSLGLAITIIIVIAIAIFGHAIAALGHPFDVDQPEDERDRLVIWRSGNLGGLVLAVAAMVGLFVYAVVQDGNLLFHTVVCGLMTSQFAEYILTILYYRRGV